MKVPRVTALDFETEGIQGRPVYPPKPVGVAIAVPGEKPEYWAWGHPTENNCTRDLAIRRLKQVGWRRGATEEMVFHHSKFDQDVAETHLGLIQLPPHRFHDTLFLAFLADPHSPSLQLKTLAERILKIPPTERDDLRDWVLTHVPEAKKKKSTWGAHISRAPGGLVGRYAIGDVARTAKLFAKLYPDIVTRGMSAAYDRERHLLPILLRTERDGFRVYHDKLRRDVLRYGGKPDAEDGMYRGGLIGELDAQIRKRLKAPGLDVDKKEELADALDRAGVMESWGTTKTGRRSVAKDSLIDGLSDDKLTALLLYRGAVATCVRTFMGPWLRVADATGGFVHTNWNQVRSTSDGGDGSGAKTGRLSSNPNFQNIPTTASPNYERIITALKKAKLLDAFMPFPLVRSYLAPDGADEVFLNRDYSQQELRILGHYEDSVLADRYNDDPWMDVHETARELIKSMIGVDFGRRAVKDTGFGLIYGMGLDKLAKKTGSDRATSGTLKDAYLAIFPGLKALDEGLKWRARSGEAIRTWGGREYYVEEPRFSEKYGRMQTFEYKLLNMLIQGSAADNTKQAILNYDAHPKREARFLLTVHDEFLSSVKKKIMAAQMRVLREAMEAVAFDVPMLSEGEWGRDWAALKPFDTKGKEVYRGA